MDDDDQNGMDAAVTRASCTIPGFKALLSKWKVQDASVDQGSSPDVCSTVVSSSDGTGTSASAIMDIHKAKGAGAGTVMNAKQKLKAAQRLRTPRPSETAPVTDAPMTPPLTKTKRRQQQSQNANVYQLPLTLEKDFSPPKFPHSFEEKRLIRKALQNNFVFSDLTDRDLLPLVAAFERCTFEKDQMIIQQGDPGDFFYILAGGNVSFLVNDVTVGKTSAIGASFGELALLYTCPRAASVVAQTQTQLFRVDQTTFRFILKSQTIESGKEKTELLQNVCFLKDLTQTDLKKLSDAMTPVVFEKDKVLVKKGDIGDAFYLLQEGQVLVKDISVGPTSYQDQTLGPGDYFGERALATSDPRAANVVAVTAGIAFSIDRNTFEKVLGNMSRLILRAQDTRKLQGIKVICDADLDASQMSTLAQLIRDQKYMSGRIIMVKGQKTKAALYLVREGKVHLKSDTVDQVVERGGYFGHEMIAAGNAERVNAPYTVTAALDCVCGILTLVECQTVFELHKDDCGFGGAHQEGPMEQQVPGTTAKLEDLERHTILGEGNFGQVWLVSECLPDNSRRPYALKIQSKYDLAEEGQIASVVEEKNIMMKMHHPFIIKLFQTYQDENFVYMLQEMGQGGELFSVMADISDDDTTKFRRIPEPQVKFYTIAIADALAYLHRGKYVFRDLKPENVMIDRFGYPVVIDFGFCKYVSEKTYTLCGTPAYLPPEVVMSRGHNCSADHWSLGIMLYEMITGENPFYYDGMNQMSLFKSIVQDDYEAPMNASPAVADIIAKFLVKEPTQRLGSLARGEREIFEQEWFTDMDLQALRLREIEAPWVPGITDALDTEWFDDWNHLEDKTKKVYPRLKEKDVELFKNF
jgi:CRP-like cAMP-binding protein